MSTVLNGKENSCILNYATHMQLEHNNKFDTDLHLIN